MNCIVNAFSVSRELVIVVVRKETQSSILTTSTLIRGRRMDQVKLNVGGNLPLKCTKQDIVRICATSRNGPKSLCRNQVQLVKTD